ncbi:MAG: branched-chain amino acid ABC transporter permease [Nitrospirae bacterium]|nr:branched-chain amino acid ABC transporter permease [Nitrospirota bacterium]
MEQQLIVNGLSIGIIYVLIAIGYTLIFGILQVIFFAQGELSMMAAFAAITVYNRFPQNAYRHSPFVIFAIMVLTAIVFAILAGLLSERIALRPIRHAPRIKALITSLGMSIVLQNIVMNTFGPQSFYFPPIFSNDTLALPGVVLSYRQIFIFILTVLLILVLDAFLKYNKYGLSIKALAQNPQGAQLMGIEINKTVTIMFVMSSTTAAIAGVCMGMTYGVAKFDMGFIPGIKGFTVAIVGGIGNLHGALLAGLLLGVGEALFSGYISTDYKDLLVFLLLLFILLVRPQGLLGGRR